ncbi:MAG: tetratricopeptide repeat protein [Acidobacteria bacterium]|nr:tetratricopeptide repeat protein [Acidobacteriota bacterium]
MLRLFSGRRLVVFVLTAVVAVALAAPVFAQTGSVKGKVVDPKGKPVDKAVILIEFTDGITYKVDTKTNNKGEFIQIGLRPGNYKVTASTKELGDQAFNVRVRLGDPSEVNFTLGGTNTAAAAAEAAKNEALKKTFDEGVNLSKAGNFDAAIAKFTEAAALVPKCFDCYYNVGFAFMQKKEYDKAEEAFNKAIEFKADYFEAYNGLATVYNAQKKFDKAGEASQKASELAAAAGPAGGGGSVDAEYNNGVIDWNAGKIPEAQAHFQKVIELKPDHAEAHYQLAMSFLNQGKMPEAIAMFERYLVLAPQGPNAATATGILKTLKK